MSLKLSSCILASTLNGGPAQPIYWKTKDFPSISGI